MVLPSGTSPCSWSFLLFLVLQKLTLLQTEPFGYEDKRMGENATKVNPSSQGCLPGGVWSWGGESPCGRKKGRKAVGLSGQEQEYSFHQECISRLDHPAVNKWTPSNQMRDSQATDPSSPPAPPALLWNLSKPESTDMHLVSLVIAGRWFSGISNRNGARPGPYSI